MTLLRAGWRGQGLLKIDHHLQLAGQGHQERNQEKKGHLKGHNHMLAGQGHLKVKTRGRLTENLGQRQRKQLYLSEQVFIVILENKL